MCSINAGKGSRIQLTLQSSCAEHHGWITVLPDRESGFSCLRLIRRQELDTDRSDKKHLFPADI